MCILFVAIGQHPEFPFIVAHNRDETLLRNCIPMKPATWCIADSDESVLLAGRDLQAGGTWLGLRRLTSESSQSCRFATILNLAEVQEPQHADAPSRGSLPLRFLLSPFQVTPAGFVESIALEPVSDVMAGFVLLCASVSPSGDVQASIVRNCLGSPTDVHKESANAAHVEGVVHLPPGVYALGNDGSLTSSWPRVRHGLRCFVDILTSKLAGSREQLMKVMFEKLLLDTSETAVGSAPECNPVFISPKQNLSGDSYYGTRFATVVIGDANGMINVAERCFDEVPPPHGNQALYSSTVTQNSEDWVQVDERTASRRARL